jgi:hypothetical protein
VRTTTPTERTTVIGLAALMLLALAFHVVTKEHPGPSVFSPTAIRADLLLLPDSPCSSPSKWPHCAWPGLSFQVALCVGTSWPANRRIASSDGSNVSAGCRPVVRFTLAGAVRELLRPVPVVR